MKNIFTFIIISIAMQANSKQITVSNLASTPGQYSTVNAAIAAASDNDTIIVQGSVLKYAEFTVNKPLHIYGSGHHPANFSHLPTTVSGIILKSVSSSGSLIEGFSMEYLSMTGGEYDNVTIRNCKISQQFYLSGLVTNCLMEGNVMDGVLRFEESSSTSMIVRNNLFIGKDYQAAPNISGINSQVVIDHNTFIAATSGQVLFTDVKQAIITNNIFQNYDFSITNGNPDGYSNCIFYNNATFLCNAIIPAVGSTGSGNILDKDPQFVKYPAVPTTWDWSNDLHIKTTSPLHNAATDGTDIGVYGGNFEFHQSGEPHGVPVIRTLNVRNTAVPLNGTLNVNFEATSPR